MASPAPVASAAVSGVVVTVACRSNPERLTIKNNRSRAITITKVGSTYQPRTSEPFTVNKVLGAGKSITYRFGTGGVPTSSPGPSSSATPHRPRRARSG